VQKAKGIQSCPENEKKGLRRENRTEEKAKRGELAERVTQRSENEHCDHERMMGLVFVQSAGEKR